MATHQSKAQKETMGRVMHEFKHAELETGRGRKVRNPRQAIAIGLREAGASKYESKEKNRENLRRTERANDAVQPRKIGPRGSKRSAQNSMSRRFEASQVGRR